MSTLTLAQAQSIVAAALEGGPAAGLVAVSVVVTDTSGGVRAAARNDAAPPFGVDIARGKAATALGFGRSTIKTAAVFGDKPAIVTGLGAAVGTFLPLGGGVVIVDGDIVVGYAGVAGGAPDMDHDVIAAAVAKAGLAIRD